MSPTHDEPHTKQDPVRRPGAPGLSGNRLHTPQMRHVPASKALASMPFDPDTAARAKRAAGQTSLFYSPQAGHLHSVWSSLDHSFAAALLSRVRYVLFGGLQLRRAVAPFQGVAGKR